MSRVAKRPVSLPKGVEISQSGGDLTVKGPKGELNMRLNPEVAVTIDTEAASVAPNSGSRFAYAVAGTTRALLNNMVLGVSEGFERKLALVGVGYRAKAQGAKLNLTVAAEIRGYRPPEPYKGKGVRYSDERVILKEAKKK